MDDELKGLREAIVASLAESDMKLEMLTWQKDLHEKVILHISKQRKNDSWAARAYKTLIKINNDILIQLEFQKQAKDDIAVIDKELE